MIGHLLGWVAELVFVPVCKQNFYGSPICTAAGTLLHEGLIEPAVNALTIGSAKNAYKEGNFDIAILHKTFEDLTICKLATLMAGSIIADKLIAGYISHHIVVTTISGMFGGVAIDHFYDQYSPEIFCGILAGGALLLYTHKYG